MSKYTFLCIAALVMFVIGCGTQVRQLDYTPFKKPVTLSTTTEEMEKRPWEYEISAKKEAVEEKKEEEVYYKSATKIN